MSGYKDKFDKSFEETPIDELVNAPVDALQGVSPRHAELLKEAFNIKTVGDLGRNKYFRTAQGLSALDELA